MGIHESGPFRSISRRLMPAIRKEFGIGCPGEKERQRERESGSLTKGARTRTKISAALSYDPPPLFAG